MQDHLHAFVNNFIRPERRERLNWLISRRRDEKRWFQAKLELFSFSPIRHDLRYAVRLTDDESVPSNLLQRLQRADAPETCYRLSLYKAGRPSDEEELSLDEALASPHLYGGTLISCVPGALVVLSGDVRGHDFLFMKRRTKPEPPNTLELGPQKKHRRLSGRR
jgi:hypothetical protein